MLADRLSTEYKKGVDSFLEFTIENVKDSNLIPCPCIKCGNLQKIGVKKIKEHLYFNGIDQSYKQWIWHSEKVLITGFSSKKSIRDDYELDLNDDLFEMIDDAQYETDVDPIKFQSLLNDAEKPIYPGCTKFTKLSALLKLYNLKARHGWSDKSFSDLLALLGEMLPNDNEMPHSFYEAKKTLCSLGMQYDKIHACPNDCILYRKKFKDAICCPVCGEPRWQQNKNSEEIKVGTPAKVLWYIPLIPRFTRLFRNREHAKDLIWHANERIEDGKLRHPADSPAWKTIDYKWPSFGSDPRNLRLGLSADGINPHTTLSSKYSCWPVMLVIYNLPPWLCMKRKFTLLTMLISGPRQPGNDIDVYLAPLIDDLNSLWNDGVKAYDAYKDEDFTLKDVLLWTINDFPAYGNLSGFSTKGYKACPICDEKTSCQFLTHARKLSYMGHRRFLPRKHIYRNWKKAFNSSQEFELAP